MADEESDLTLGEGVTHQAPGEPAPVPATSDDLELGQTIRGFVEGQMVFERFLLRRILGRGGMGVVWLARDERLERDVALKFLPEMVTRDPSAIDELKLETRKCLDITHRHIVRIHDLVEDASSAAIVMEFVDGATLAAMKVDRPDRTYEPDDLMVWLGQLAEALDYAHEHGRIVHRDLKPANLMISGAGDLKVTDFGIASSITDSVSRLSLARHGNTSGTLAYMSPQQATGKTPQASDDIYSLGATIYELLTGKPPFFSGNIYGQLQDSIPPTVFERRREFQGDAAVAIPPEWEETIAAALSKDAALRPQSAGKLVERLRTLPAPAPARSSRRALIAAVSVLVLVATGTGIWMERESLFPPPPPTRGSLTVSAPEGAILTLNDGRVLTIPLEGLELSQGDYSGVISKPGFEPTPVSFVVQPGQGVALKPPVLSPTMGAISLAGNAPRGGGPVHYELIPLLLDTQTTSDPPREDIESRTGTIPVTLEDLPTGRYQVTLSSEGWPDLRQQILIGSGSASSVTWDPPAATLALKIDPPTASVSVDGKVIDGGAGDHLDLTPGRHEIIARREGWPALTRTVELSPNTTTTERFAFPPARVVIKSTPTGATVTRNETPLGQTPLTLDDVVPGSHLFSLSLSGYEPESLTAEATPGGSVVLSADLAAVPKPTPKPTAQPTPRKSSSSSVTRNKKPSSSTSSSDPVRRGIENQYRRGQITREEYLNAIKNL